LKEIFKDIYAVKTFQKISMILKSVFVSYPKWNNEDIIY